MARVFSPIMDCVPSHAKRNWPNVLLDLLDEFTGDDQYTYTMRVDVPEEQWAAVKAKLVEQPDTADLIKLFEENDWSISFLVDGW